MENVSNWKSFFKISLSLDAQRLCAAIIAGLAWFALSVQITCDMSEALSQNLSIAATLIHFFSFFTIQTNLLIALVLTLTIARPQADRFLTLLGVQSALATYIVIVGVVYTLMLRHLWHPQGLQLVADRMLHDAIPLLYPLYWLIFMPKGIIRKTDPLLWLIYPLIYFIYILTRGAMFDVYPYPFLDVVKLGYYGVLYNALILLAAFLMLGAAFAAVDGALGFYRARKTSRGRKRSQLGRAAEL